MYIYIYIYMYILLHFNFGYRMYTDFIVKYMYMYKATLPLQYI